jgi:hypothetical protein
MQHPLLFLLTVACGAEPADTPDSATEPDSRATQETAEPALLPCDTWASPEEVGKVADSSLEEISGLAVSQQNPGVIWIHEDSGAQAVITALNAGGATLGTLTLSNAENQDWEDLALGPCEAGTCLWVGDFGDNGNSRTDVALLSVPEPQLNSTTGFALTAEALVHPFAYPEGPQDAEALVVDPSGQPFVLTKRTDQSSRIYRIPLDESGMAMLVGSINTGPFSGLPTATTAATLWPDGSRLLVRGYLYSFQLALENGQMDSAPTGAATQVLTALEKQGEAIGYDAANGAIYHISEGKNPALWRLSCADSENP